MHPHLHVVAAAILRSGRCLATRRSCHMPLPGKWELPGGKVETGEDPRSALAREVMEELGLAVEVGSFLAQGCSDQGSRRVVLDVYLARIRGGELFLREHAEHRWCAAEDLGELEWAEADRPAVEALEHLLRRPAATAVALPDRAGR